MARQQGEPLRRRLPRFVVAAPRAILEIVALYAIASLVDGSLADVSRPVGSAIVAGVVAVLLLGRWLLTRDGSPSRGGEVRAAARPPGKFAPTATLVDRHTTPGPGARGTRGHQSTSDARPALQRSGETSELAEYLDGRTELANLIARVEARLPTGPEPSVRLDAVSHRELEDTQRSLAQSAKMLTQAVEQVARACELIAHVCELVAERVESERLERRTLADALMMLAQQPSPPASTPRFVNARPIPQRVIV